jgi:hypothetical protein
MYRSRRKSFIGHPDATHFRRKFCERVFQQPRLITTANAELPRSERTSERGGNWFTRSFGTG